MRIHRSLGVESLVALMAAHRENGMVPRRAPTRLTVVRAAPERERRALATAGTDDGTRAATADHDT